jgi:hypothetical protein
MVRTDLPTAWRSYRRLVSPVQVPRVPRGGRIESSLGAIAGIDH